MSKSQFVGSIRPQRLSKDRYHLMLKYSCKSVQYSMESLFITLKKNLPSPLVAAIIDAKSFILSKMNFLSSSERYDNCPELLDVATSS